MTAPHLSAGAVSALTKAQLREAREQERALLRERILAYLGLIGAASFRRIQRKAVPAAHFRAVDGALQSLREDGLIQLPARGPKEWSLVLPTAPSTPSPTP